MVKKIHKKKVLIVFGTRPEAIKMAPLIYAFRSDQHFDLKVCVTAQHRGMLDQVLKFFEVKPDFDLNLMKSGQSLGDITNIIIKKMKQVLISFCPDIVLVHGDTTTSFASALSSFYEQIPVGHVEAGLRTGNNYSPWPEEMNRKLVGTLANFHFAPTQNSKNNLMMENISEDNIFITGNTVIDALHISLKKLAEKGSLKNGLTEKFTSLGLKSKYILVTGHRRENFGVGFQNICLALKELASRYPKIDIVYPVHLNPNVKDVVWDLISGKENIKLIEPLDYFDFIDLMQNSLFVITDSGGIQEEAPALGKPVLVMRDTTERPEALEAGTVLLTGTDPEKIVKLSEELLTKGELYQNMARAVNPYGDGSASSKIVECIKRVYFD